uniref:Uncharacterized protein n=1 Tax=Solanum tuberosum TaxID=4113 RepID=M1DDA1_SOLTU
MDEMMTQLDLLSKYVIGCRFKSVNMFGASSGLSPEDANFEAMYDEKFQLLSNQVGNSLSSNPRTSVNQGWNEDRHNGWRYHERDCHDRAANWREHEGSKYRYASPHECSKLSKYKWIWRVFGPKIC